LDRSQALNLLKEIARKCPLIDEKTVSLSESNPYDLASKGCQIIVGGINKDDKTCIRKALADYDYLIKELSDRMVIYDPAQLKCPECGRTFDSTKELKTHITASHYSKEYEQTEMPTGRM
jgi:endogenous inhibitor of DNA gyrase (YacG/DUF329 family)